MTGPRTSSAHLAAQGIACLRGSRTVVSGVDLDVRPGARLALVGPNGAGKSTLLRTLSGMSSPAAGTVTVDGHDLHRMTSRRRARTVAVMGQEEVPSAELTLAEAVSLGRTPHRSPWALGESGDDEIVARALDVVGLVARAEDSCTRLSGGERHRVVLARALAQTAPVLVLDEPTNHLDAAWRLRLMDTLDALECTVVAAVHDLDLVLRHFDSVAVLHEGAVVAQGPPADVLDADLVRRVFGVHGDIVHHPRTWAPHLLLSSAEPRQQ